MSHSCHWLAHRAFPIIMALALLAAAGAQGASAQQTYTPDSLFVALFANGDSLIEYDVLISDPTAKSVTIQLFGSNVKDVIVTDYEDKILSFQQGSKPGEIVVTPDGATGAKIFCGSGRTSHGGRSDCCSQRRRGGRASGGGS